MRVESFADFDALRATEATPAAPAPATLFRSLDWFEHLARHGMADAAALYLLRIAPASAVPGGAVPPAPTFHLPLLRQGSGLASLSNYYSGIYGPINSDGSEDGGAAIWTAACRHLRASQPRPAFIRLHPLDAEGTFFRDMRVALSAAGYWVDAYFCFGNWYLPTAGRGFDDYLSARPSALRNTLKRGRHKLDRAGNWQVDLYTAPGPRLDAAIEAYESIYRSSWKPAEAHPRFIRELCQMAARKGWLRLGVLSLDGKAMASQIWLFSAGSAYIFKLSYDPAAAPYSAGTVLTAAMMEHAIERDGAVEVDYLSGDDAYKQDWMSHRRERLGLIAYDPATLRGLLGGLRHFGGRALKSLFHRAKT